jgi:hypothetical protein
MDFFRGLDNVWYSTFKTNYINYSHLRQLNLPRTLMKFIFSNQWLKPKAAGSGYASTFITMLNHLDERRNNGDRRRWNRTNGKKQQEVTDR